MTTGEIIQVASFLVLAGVTAWYAYQTQKLSKQSTKAAVGPHEGVIEWVSGLQDSG